MSHVKLETPRSEEVSQVQGRPIWEVGIHHRADGEGNGTPLQYSCLENPMDRGAWKATVHGVAEGWI